MMMNPRTRIHIKKQSHQPQRRGENSAANEHQPDDNMDDQSQHQHKLDIEDFDENGSSLVSYGTPPPQQSIQNKRKQQTICSMI